MLPKIEHNNFMANKITQRTNKKATMIWKYGERQREKERDRLN